NKWLNKAALPQSRTLSNGAAVINGVLYVPGGLNTGGTYTNTLYAYTASTNTWTTKAPVPAAGGCGTSAAIGGKLSGRTVIGGGFGFTSRLDRYDPATNAWTPRAAPPTTRSFTASGVINGKLYRVGGQANEPSAGLEVYDPATNKWTVKA